MRLSAPVVIMSGGVRQHSYGIEVEEIDFDEVKELDGEACIRYCVNALASLTIDEAADTVTDLLDRIDMVLTETIPQG